jgi:polysaccharide pyruvyl transferase WcaK-like protein
MVVRQKRFKVRDRERQTKIAFFGHFNATNFGNESTLQAILYNLRRFRPDAKVICISTGPETVTATHHIEAVPIAERLFGSWKPGASRKLCISLPSQLYQWAKCFMRLRHIDMLVIPGTGLLTDTYSLFNEGPYNLFKWSLVAKLCRCKLLLVSVGAGPIYSTRGRWLVKSILSLADFRSYRDHSTLQYLASIGFRAENDRVYPDLAFSLPEAAIPNRDTGKRRRSVVGLGIMPYAGKYSVANPTDKTYLAYLENLVLLVKWLLGRGYDVRLLIGDIGDTEAIREFGDLLKGRISACDEEHIIDEPISSVENLLSQIAATDLVVATRFHNVLLSLFCNKPVISISFHHKCEALMSAMGLSEYCLNINDLSAAQLIERFCDLEANCEKIKSSISEKARKFRAALDQQYEIIFDKMLTPKLNPTQMIGFKETMN